MGRQTTGHSHPRRRVQSGAESSQGGSMETRCDRHGPRHSLGKSCSSFRRGRASCLSRTRRTTLCSSSTSRERSQKCVDPHGRSPEVGSYGRLSPLHPEGGWRASIPHTRACRDRIQQAVKDIGDEHIFIAEACLNQHPSPGDEAPEAELAAEESRAGSSPPRNSRSSWKQSLQTTQPTTTTTTRRTETVQMQMTQEQAAADCSRQPIAQYRCQRCEEMLSVVFKSWLYEWRKETSKLLFFVHGAEPGLMKTKVAQLFGSPLPLLTVAIGKLRNARSRINI